MPASGDLADFEKAPGHREWHDWMMLDVHIIAGMVILFPDIRHCRKFGTGLKSRDDIFFWKLANGLPVYLSGRGTLRHRVHANQKETSHFFKNP
jgi:hypothetical protein